MALGIDELGDLLDEVTDRIRKELTIANRQECLDELLKKWGLSDLITNKFEFDSYLEGKIVVIGMSEVKEDILVLIGKKLGIEKSRFEFCLDYDAAKRYDYKKLHYAPQYRVILFGPVPHSSSGKNESSSVIPDMKKKDGYPRVEKLCSNNTLKITKSNFETMLRMLIQENYIECNI